MQERIPVGVIAIIQILMNRTNFDEVSKEFRLLKLQQSRIEALDGTAEAIRKIKKQQVITENVGESGLAEICEAVSCAEEAMFYLATAAAEDESGIRKILTDYGFEDLCPDIPADGD